MTELLTKTEFSVYALFYCKFGLEKFSLGTIKWYLSRQMIKKIVFKLVKGGWIKRIEKGVYRCNSPNANVIKLFERKVEERLRDVKMPYCFSQATAAEIWSDEVYIQRSWEYHPIYINILKKDIRKWKSFLEVSEIQFFVKHPDKTIGKFIVLNPVNKLEITLHNSMPVEPLDNTIEFCEKYFDVYEYVLAYIQKKYGKKTFASKESLIKVSEAL